jgi:hypothetical protein
VSSDRNRKEVISLNSFVLTVSVRLVMPPVSGFHVLSSTHCTGAPSEGKGWFVGLLEAPIGPCLCGRGRGVGCSVPVSLKVGLKSLVERWGYSSIVECLPSIGETPGSILSTKKKKIYVIF